MLTNAFQLDANNVSFAYCGKTRIVKHRKWEFAISSYGSHTINKV